MRDCLDIQRLYNYLLNLDEDDPEYINNCNNYGKNNLKKIVEDLNTLENWNLNFQIVHDQYNLFKKRIHENLNHDDHIFYSKRKKSQPLNIVCVKVKRIT